MKFRCDSCQAEYLIADEKVGRRGVKVRCKRCTNVIIVRPHAPVGSRDADAAGPRTAGLGLVREEPLGEEAMGEEPAGDVPAVEEAASGPASLVAPVLPSAEDASGEDLDPALALAADDPFIPPWEARDGAAQQAGPGAERTLVTAMASPSRFDATQQTPAEEVPGDGGPATEGRPWEAATARLSHEMTLPTAPAEQERSLPDDVSLPSGGPSPVFSPGAPPGLPADATSEGDLAMANGLPFELSAGGADALTPSAEPPSAEPLAVRPSAESDGDELDAQLEGAFAQMFDSGEGEGAGNSGPILGPDASQAAALPLMSSGAEASDVAAGGSPAAADEWYVALHDDHVGPVSLDEVRRHFAEGALGAGTLVWQPHMADWQVAADTPPLQGWFRERNAHLHARDEPAASAHDSLPQDLLPKGPLDADELMLAPGEAAPYGAMPPAALSGFAPAGLGESFPPGSAAPLALEGGPVGPESLSDDDEGWRPGAASALASLAQAELQQDEPPAVSGPAGAAAPPPPPLEAWDLDAAPSLSLPAVGPVSGGPLSGSSVSGSPVPAVAASPTGAMAPGYGVTAPPYGAPYPPAAMPTYPPAAPTSRPMWHYPAMAVGAIVAVSLVKLAFFGPPAPVAAGPLALAPPSSLPAQAASTDASPAPVAVDASAAAGPSAAAPTEALPAQGPAAVPAPPTASAAPPAASPEEGGARVDAKGADIKERKTRKDRADKAEKSAKSAERKAGKGADERAGDDAPGTGAAEVSSSGAPAGADERRVAGTPAPVGGVSEPKAPARAPARSKDCDPVLDFDCDKKEAPRTSKGSAASDAQESLSRSDVLVVVRQNLDAVYRCFDRHSAKGPVKMEWRIDRSGRTKSVRVADSRFAGSPLGACLTEEIERWRFPRYRGKEPSPIKFPFKARG